MGKILIVEDDKKISRILKLQLERKNHEITIIENGIDALNEINGKREFYDLVLLDLGLPSMEGNEVCKNVRKISKVPIIVVSAKNNIEEKVDLLKSGASDYVTKPFDFLELDELENPTRCANQYLRTFLESLNLPFLAITREEELTAQA